MLEKELQNLILHERLTGHFEKQAKVDPINKNSVRKETFFTERNTELDSGFRMC